MSISTSLRQIKFSRKVKFFSGKSKSSQEDSKTLISKKKGPYGDKNSRVGSDDAVGFTYANNKLYKKESSERRNVKFKRKWESAYEQKTCGNRVMNPRRRGSRLFVGQSADGERMLDKGLKKVSQRGRTVVDGDVEERGWSGKSNYSAPNANRKVFGREGKSCETDSLNKNGGNKLSHKPRSVNRKDSLRTSPQNSLMKKGAKLNVEYMKKSEENRIGHGAEVIGKSTKKKRHDKQSLGNYLEENDGRPKKKKRVIRIDPYDISNKRLDDGITPTGPTKKKEEDTEKDEGVQMSMNAQFRAIKPSPSILSFVEDNLLGRRRLIELRRAGYNTELPFPLDNIPGSKSSEREKIEEPVFKNKLTYFAAANVSSSFPPPDLPEIAFAGRSNVGKSSLLNSLTRQWGVVRTSDKPGLTQTINFFKLGTKVCLVDLPGYGFAYAKEEVKEAWEELVKEYVSTRVGLKRVCLLVDTKWGMKPRDNELIELMEKSETKYQIVLTKTDLVFPIDVARRAMQIEESLKAKRSAVKPVMMVSSKSGAGIRSLRIVLSKIARLAKM